GARAIYPPQAPMMEMVYSTVFTAAQNLIVAARAVGLGSVFTTFTMQAQDEIKQILEVPEDVYLSNLIPVGWPERNFGPLARKPMEEVVHYERWTPGR
ncbi:MAG: nitroreductase family protein, partial [Myxococcota bacterium]